MIKHLLLLTLLLTLTLTTAARRSPRAVHLALQRRQIPECTEDQVAGTYDAFRITGGGGTYNAGTNQTVSYNWAT
ncbi:hypothetical protein HK104_007485, partial [Borealophlyctis nickersoniae]